MFVRSVNRLSPFFSSARSYATAGKKRVAILGAAGGIGQPLSLLLKLHSQNISELVLYDIVKAAGVAADVSHCSAPAKVIAYNNLDDALKGTDIVVIPAGVPRKPGMTREDLFNTNASIVQNLAAAAARNCPEAHLLIISNPVNSTVPIVAETFKKAGVYNKNRVFGVTTLDVVRAKTFVAELKGLDVTTLDIPVVGGHAGTTIVPLLSQNSAGVKFTEEERKALTHRIQFGGDEVVNAKEGAGSATLSMAYAGAHFTLRLLEALNGAKNIVECSYVESTLTDSPYFSSPILLGKNGVERIDPLPKVTAEEQEIINAAVPALIKSVQQGVEFVKSK